MNATLQPVGIEFVRSTRRSYVCTSLVHHPAEKVFAAVAEDPAGWGDWFPGFSRAGRYLTPPPHGLGSVREVSMMGVRYREQMIAWDHPYQWAFYVESMSLPFARALAEEYRFTPSGDQCVVQYTLALDPRAVLRVASPLIGLVLPRLFRRAMRNLDRVLRLSARHKTTWKERDDDGVC